MKTSSAYKTICQEEKIILQDTAQKVAMLVDKSPKKMDYCRKQLTTFADKWTAYETAKEAERKGKWQPSMGRPSNPLWAIWPRNAGASCFPDFGDIPPVLGGYALLAVIHDNVLPNCPSIAKEVLPKELANIIWRDLITGANNAHSSSGWVIPTDKIERFFQNVKADIENHLAPGNKTEQKPAEPKQDNKPQEKAGQGKDANDLEIDSETKEQAWRDEAPEYIPNADAIRIADGKITAPGFSKTLRKPGNTIRWMRNKETRRSKVHAQDFKQYLKTLKSPDGFGEKAFKQRERQKEIDSHKRNTGE